MALAIKDGNTAATFLRSTLNGTDHVTHHHVDSSALPTGASTTALQTIGNNLLSTIDVDTGALVGAIGAATDAAATTDTGTSSLIALTKRLLQSISEPGQVAMAASSPVVIASDQSAIQIKLGAAGGATPYNRISAATTNATSVKGSAGTITSLVAMNNHATNFAYLKLYNKASAPTVGTDTPVQTYMLAPKSGITLAIPSGMAFATGIALAITGVITVADTTAVAAAQVTVNCTYH